MDTGGKGRKEEHAERTEEGGRTQQKAGTTTRNFWSSQYNRSLP